MGMAASQARFLCLTARKSNTEYQGQQVNQQRTVLANESAGLYNRMLAMEVPTPPSSSDYYKKTYQFVPADDGADKKYKFTTSPKLIGPNLYKIGISWDVEKKELRTQLASMSVESKQDPADGSTVYKIKLGGKEYNLTKMKFDDDGYDVTEKEEVDGSYSWDTASKNMAVKKSDIKGEEDDTYYCFESTNDDGKPLKKYYISSSSLEEIMGSSSDTQHYINYDVTVVGQEYGYVEGHLTKVDSGRYNYLEITKSDIEGAFSGASESDPVRCELSITEVRDDEAYDEAMKDYEYKKDKYDKEIQDINSKTALIQQKDKSLELKLKQLDTEQEALKNELEAVQEVINKNVESTFKTFSA